MHSVYLLIITLDGKVRARKAVSGLQTERKFVQPYLGGSLPTLSTLQSGQRVCQEVCSALARVPPLLHGHCT